MPDDFMSALDESMHHEERAVRALEGIADALTAWVKLEQAKFDKLYPSRTPRDAIVTTVPSEEELLRQTLGDTGESTEEWLDIGDREREVINNKKKQ